MSEEIEKNEREYSADSIQVLEGLEAVRMRPSMYAWSKRVNSKNDHIDFFYIDDRIDHFCHRPDLVCRINCTSCCKNDAEEDRV